MLSCVIIIVSLLRLSVTSLLLFVTDIVVFLLFVVFMTNGILNQYEWQAIFIIFFFARS